MSGQPMVNPSRRSLNVRGQLAAAVVKSFDTLSRGISSLSLFDEKRMGDVRVINCIQQVFDDDEAKSKRRKRSTEGIDRIVIHRLGPSVGVTPGEIIKNFKDESRFAAGSYTGGTVPYCFQVDPWGRINQLLEIDDLAWHARAYSKPGIGVAVSGDFREHPPTWESDFNLKRLCTLLSYWIGTKCQIFGHTEMPGAGANPNKVCPGEFLDIDHLREVVDARVSEMVKLDSDGRDIVLMSCGIIL